MGLGSRQPFRTLATLLRGAGRVVSLIYLHVLGIAILILFPVLGFLGAIFAGLFAASALGLPSLVVPLTFLFGVFLSIYVWQPIVWPATRQAAHALFRHFD
jgi:hypothetical protein